MRRSNLRHVSSIENNRYHIVRQNVEKFFSDIVLKQVTKKVYLISYDDLVLLGKHYSPRISKTCKLNLNVHNISYKKCRICLNYSTSFKVMIGTLYNFALNI